MYLIAAAVFAVGAYSHLAGDYVVARYTLAIGVILGILRFVLGPIEGETGLGKAAHLAKVILLVALTVLGVQHSFR